LQILTKRIDPFQSFPSSQGTRSHIIFEGYVPANYCQKASHFARRFSKLSVTDKRKHHATVAVAIAVIFNAFSIGVPKPKYADRSMLK